MGAGAGGAKKCQLLLRMPPDMVSMVVLSVLTLPTPTLSKKPVVGLIDHKSIVVPGAYPARLGKERGAGVVNTMSPGWMVTTKSVCRLGGRAAGVSSVGTWVMLRFSV